MPKQRPTPHQTVILRRVATHKLLLTYIDGKPQYTYGDGLPVTQKDAERIVRQRWVVPESPGLWRDEAIAAGQVYVVLPAGA